MLSPIKLQRFAPTYFQSPFAILHTRLLKLNLTNLALTSAQKLIYAGINWRRLTRLDVGNSCFDPILGNGRWSLAFAACVHIVMWRMCGWEGGMGGQGCDTLELGV